MQFKYVLRDGTAITGDQHIEQEYVTHVINIHKEESDYEPEDCIYDVIVLKEEDIMYREFVDMNYDEFMEYMDMIRKIKAEENCDCSSCMDKDCDECDDCKPYATSNLDDVRSYV